MTGRIRTIIYIVLIMSEAARKAFAHLALRVRCICGFRHARPWLRVTAAAQSLIALTAVAAAGHGIWVWQQWPAIS